VAERSRNSRDGNPQICEIIRSIDATNRWALYDRDPLPRWTVGRVTLMGDAAHPMLPYMAQGAVQSIEGAGEMPRTRRCARCDCRAPAIRTNASLAHRDARKARAATPSCTISPDGDDQQKRDASLASAADAPLPQNAWRYADVEAEFNKS
jgi:salicylate hydroxylase